MIKHVETGENLDLISVVIPIYNVEKYLPDCLESVLAQTHQHIEILCIDDGSTDDSREIIHQFSQKDHRIQLLSQPNQGQGSARNLGIQNSRGKYVGFVDSDDFCGPQMFERLYQLAESTQADFMMCGLFYVDAETKKTLRSEGPILHSGAELKPEEALDFKIFQKYIMHCLPSPPIKLFRRDFLLKNRLLFPEKVKYEDGFFLTDLGVAKASGFAFTNECLYFYRANRSGSTMKSSDQSWKDHFLYLRYRYQKMKEQGFFLSSQLEVDFWHYAGRRTKAIWKQMNEETGELFFQGWQKFLKDTQISNQALKKSCVLQQTLINASNYSAFARKTSTKKLLRKEVKESGIRYFFLGFPVYKIDPLGKRYFLKIRLPFSG